MKNFIVTVMASLSLVLITGLAFPVAAGASRSPSLPGTVQDPGTATNASASKQDACAGLSQLDSSQTCDSSASQSVVGSLAHAIVNILSIVIGIAAVIMIIIAGFRFVTSNGDSNGVASAKSSLIYALVGLVIASIAQFLVHYVLNHV